MLYRQQRFIFFQCYWTQALLRKSGLDCCISDSSIYRKKRLKRLFTFILCCFSRDSKAFKAPSSVYIVCFVKMLFSTQFYVWCIVVMTWVFCTAGWIFLLSASCQKKEKNPGKNLQDLFFSRWRVKNKTESCRILEWSELFFCRNLHRWNFQPLPNF